MTNRKYLPGDIFELSDGHKTVVVEIDEDCWPIKLKSLEPGPELGKIGWFWEEGEWVVYQYTIVGGVNNN